MEFKVWSSLSISSSPLEDYPWFRSLRFTIGTTVDSAGFNLVTQPQMSRLTTVMTQVMNEDSGGEGYAVTETATDVTPASWDATRLAGRPLFGHIGWVWTY